MQDRIAGSVFWPFGKTCAVGVTATGEVCPVAHHLIAQLAVFRAPLGSGPRVEGTEDVLDVVGMEGERTGMKFTRRSGKIKLVAVDIWVAGLAIDLHPLPGSIGDEAITTKV